MGTLGVVPCVAYLQARRRSAEYCHRAHPDRPPACVSGARATQPAASPAHAAAPARPPARAPQFYAARCGSSDGPECGKYLHTKAAAVLRYLADVLTVHGDGVVVGGDEGVGAGGWGGSRPRCQEPAAASRKPRSRARAGEAGCSQAGGWHAGRRARHSTHGRRPRRRSAQDMFAAAGGVEASLAALEALPDAEVVTYQPTPDMCAALGGAALAPSWQGAARRLLPLPGWRPLPMPPPTLYRASAARAAGPTARRRRRRRRVAGGTSCSACCGRWRRRAAGRV